MWVNGIWIEYIKKPRRSKHLAYVARDYIEDADFEEITEMNSELKLKLTKRFEVLMAGAVALGGKEPSKDLHDILLDTYLKGAQDAIDFIKETE